MIFIDNVIFEKILMDAFAHEDLKTFSKHLQHSYQHIKSNNKDCLTEMATNFSDINSYEFVADILGDVIKTVTEDSHDFNMKEHTIEELEMVYQLLLQSFNQDSELMDELYLFINSFQENLDHVQKVYEYIEQYVKNDDIVYQDLNNIFLEKLNSYSTEILRFKTGLEVFSKSANTSINDHAEFISQIQSYIKRLKI